MDVVAIGLFIFFLLLILYAKREKLISGADEYLDNQTGGSLFTDLFSKTFWNSFKKQQGDDDPEIWEYIGEGNYCCHSCKNHPYCTKKWQNESPDPDAYWTKRAGCKDDKYTYCGPDTGVGSNFGRLEPKGRHVCGTVDCNWNPELCKNDYLSYGQTCPSGKKSDWVNGSAWEVFQCNTKSTIKKSDVHCNFEHGVCDKKDGNGTWRSPNTHCNNEPNGCCGCKSGYTWAPNGNISDNKGKCVKGSGAIF
jgi:hypothetical protein